MEEAGRMASSLLEACENAAFPLPSTAILLLPKICSTVCLSDSYAADKAPLAGPPAIVACFRLFAARLKRAPFLAILDRHFIKDPLPVGCESPECGPKRISILFAILQFAVCRCGFSSPVSAFFDLGPQKAAPGWPFSFLLPSPAGTTQECKSPPRPESGSCLTSTSGRIFSKSSFSNKLRLELLQLAGVSCPTRYSSATLADGHQVSLPLTTPAIEDPYPPCFPVACASHGAQDRFHRG